MNGFLQLLVFSVTQSELYALFILSIYVLLIYVFTGFITVLFDTQSSILDICVKNRNHDTVK
jgi:hypothetical protein